MLTDNQVDRLASAANIHRPDWPVRSLVTLIQAQRQRTYRDVAVALAWIACDPQTKTPGRLAESGPWWTAANIEASEGFERYRMRCSEHPAEKAGQCRACAALAVPVAPPVVRDTLVRLPRVQTTAQRKAKFTETKEAS